MEGVSNYLQYGVRDDWAKVYIEKGLSASVFRSTSQKLLTDKFGIQKEEVRTVKNCLKRDPIDEDVVERLLYNSRYTCCLCRGQKSDAYIIHHIEEYSKTQDNEYSNLAVLCPNDHELAHREGLALARKTTPDQVRRAKARWEKEVVRQDVEKACLEGDISEIDFVNPQRVLTLYKKLWKAKPLTDYSAYLEEEGILSKNGDINFASVNQSSRYPDTPFMSNAPQISFRLSSHFIEVFKLVLQRLAFTDLDELLTKKKATKELIGTHCFYVGGLYGKMPELPITEATTPTRLYFHRRNFWTEWMVDPQYMISNTAFHRLADHMEYQIYGVIRNVSEFENKAKMYTRLDIRPYLFGMPSKTKLRRPEIHFKSKFTDFGEGDDENPF